MKNQLTKELPLNFIFINIFFIFLLGCEPPQKEEKIPVLSKVEPALFTNMNPKVTGLYFVNEMKESENLNVLTYEYLYNGAGVAIGDVNNDGLPDVFFSANLFGGRLFVNKGNLKFEQISETANVFQNGFTTGVSMVDINGDGYDDIYLCKSLALQPELRANVLLINNQDGTFTNKAKEYGLDDRSFSNYANFFDYDNDGDLDMYLLNHRIDFQEALTMVTFTDEDGRIVKPEKDIDYENVSDRLYRNNGNGTFTDVTKKARLLNNAFGLSVTTTDINKDGWMDLYVANDYVDKDHFYINNGDGTFTDTIDEMFFHMSKNAMGSDIADINNDGLMDLINLDMMAEGNQRQKQLKGQNPYDQYHMAVDYGLSHQVMRNTLQLNNGNGTFSEIGQLSGVSHTDWSWTPLFADFDNDGLKDLFVSNGYYKDLTDMDYIKYDSNTAIQKAGGKDNVKRTDLVKLLKSNPPKNYIYKNNGDLTFSKKSNDWGFTSSSFSNGAVYADLDLDGDLDLITNNYNSESVLYRNNSRELQPDNKYLSIQLNGTKNNPNGVGATVIVTTSKGEQHLESSPYRGYFSSVEPLLHFGLGKGIDSVFVRVNWPNGKFQELKNVKVNQRLVVDISKAKKRKFQKKKSEKPLLAKVQNQLTKKHLHKEDNFIDFKREPLLEHKISNKGPFLTKGDVNGDGLEDLYIGGASGQSGTLYLQKTSGDFVKKPIVDLQKDADHEDVQAVFFDADNDADLDLYVVSGGYAFPEGSNLYQDRLYLNDGKGNLTKTSTALPKLTANGTTVLALDVDKDGDKDLFIGGNALPNAYPYPDQSFLLLNNEGAFSDASKQLPNNGKLGMINDALWLDVDNDNSSELILAGEWMPITFLKFEDSKFKKIKIKGFENSSGWWNTIEAADMDGDGDLDLIGGNRGNNSFFKASKEKPAFIYAKDFDENGSIDAFPFYYFSDGKSHPKHVLDEIFSQYPNIRRKFQRYKDYSNATLSDIFTKEEQKGMLTLKVETFSSLLFENLGDGSFNSKPLPQNAQLSEAHGILPADVNRDGYLDLLITGNNYGVDVEMGRSDANVGTVLLNDGKGNLNPASINKTGFFIPEDTRGIFTVGDLLLIMVNSGKPYAFKVKK
tara:strand:+ start:7383 stop:10748 length:3366 start_codon:yes stop_codon:yes gene_type:complete